jgi:hypothetical protein
MDPVFRDGRRFGSKSQVAVKRFRVSTSIPVQLCAFLLTLMQVGIIQFSGHPSVNRPIPFEDHHCQGYLPQLCKQYMCFMRDISNSHITQCLGFLPRGFPFSARPLAQRYLSEGSVSLTCKILNLLRNNLSNILLCKYRLITCVFIPRDDSLSATLQASRCVYVSINDNGSGRRRVLECVLNRIHTRKKKKRDVVRQAVCPA